MNMPLTVPFRCALALGLLLVASPLLAASHTVRFTVEAGPHDRVDTPVIVPITLPTEFAKIGVADVFDGQGKQLIGQITPPRLLAENKEAGAYELTFMLPALKAGSSAEFSATINDPAKTPREVYRWQTGEEHDDLTFAGRPVLRYMHAPYDPATREQNYKVFHHVYSPDGKQLVTKGPGGRYTHHRGLFYGFNRVTYGDGKRCDIWHCSGDTHQLHSEVVSSEAGPVLGRHLVRISWNAARGETFATELRELTVYHAADGQLIEFASRLASEDGKIHLDGDPQHAGFHFRAADEVASATAKQTYYIRPDGQDTPGKTRNWPGNKDHVNLSWNAMSFVVGGERYTAAYLDRPLNPKEARFSERDYGRFGSYFVYDLEPGKTLDLNYRVWLQAGELTPTAVAAHDANFDTPIKVTVAATK